MLWVCTPPGGSHASCHGPHSKSTVPKFLISPSKPPRRLLAFFIGWLVLTSLAVGASRDRFPGESAKWRRYQSPNFELFSANRDSESRELLHDLELLRALFYQTFKLKERQPQEVTIYFFSEDKAFKAYCQPQQRQSLAGYYLYRPDRAVIAISPAWSDESQRYVIFHEYIHHLNRALASDPPLWYNEGVAELFSTIEVEKNHAMLGKPLPWHISSLRRETLLPLEKLFAVDWTSPIYNNGKHSGQFYAESWALLHFWHFGNTKLDRRKFELFTLYLMNEPDGAVPSQRRQVFKDLLGFDFPEMEKLLADYVSGGSFSFYEAPLPKIFDSKSYEWRAVDHDEIRDRLAELSLRVNRSSDARLVMLQATEKSPVTPRVWEVLGTDAGADGDYDVAEERWQKALDAGSHNPAIFHEIGQIEARRWFARFDYYFRLPPPRAEQLRTLLKRSIECAPDQFAAYETLAWVEASVAKPNLANVNLVQEHFKSLRDKSRTLVALALVRVHLDDQTGATTLLDQLALLKSDNWVENAAEIVRAQLEGRAPRKINRPETPEPSQTIRMTMPELPK